MNKEWKHYTVGFYFTTDLSQVLLIRKAKPDWQAGRFNGIGGSFEGTEQSEACMMREFAEETGNEKHETWLRGSFFKNDWKKFGEGEVTVHQGNCFLHYMVASGEKFPIYKVNNEECVWLYIDELPIDIIPNISFLVPMARNVIQKPWWSEVATFRTII